MNPNERVLVTGANGLLGQRVVARLVALGAEVHAIIRSQDQERIPSVQYHVIDLSSAWKANVLPSSIDRVVHLAQSSKYRDFPEQAADVFKVNIASTSILLDYCVRAGGKQFVYASSGGVYGSADFALDESNPLVSHNNLGFYLGSKLCGEILVQSYTSLLGVCIVRPFFIFGSGQKRSMLIPRLADNVRKREAIGLQGVSGIKINPIHVDDAAASMASILSKGLVGVYNIAGPEVLSLKDIVDCIGSRLGIDPVYNVTNEKPNDLVGDIRRMRSDVHEPFIRFSDRIDDIL